MSGAAKIAVIVAGLLTIAIVTIAVGVEGIWDGLIGLATCIESHGACP
jgi:hypothetical protein